MDRKVAFCLVENSKGQVLLIQRGYGSQKYKWSLPGGHVDHKESYARAAQRETREETGLRVNIVSTILEGRRHPIKTFAGVIGGGKLKIRRHECLDAKFFNYDNVPSLAFSNDRRSIDTWQKMKDTHHKLASQPMPFACPYCDGLEISIRRYPHRTNHYRCRSCRNAFESATRPQEILHPGGSEIFNNNWERLGRIDAVKAETSQFPEWVMDSLPNLNMREALSRNGFYQLVGNHYRYALIPSGGGGIDFLRKKRPHA